MLSFIVLIIVFSIQTAVNLLLSHPVVRDHFVVTKGQELCPSPGPRECLPNKHWLDEKGASEAGDTHTGLLTAGSRGRPRSWGLRASLLQEMGVAMWATAWAKWGLQTDSRAQGAPRGGVPGPGKVGARAEG